MPSDERIEQALEAFSGQIQAFQSALAVTIDQMSAYASTQGAAKEQKADRIATELGPFAANLVDPGEFSQFAGDNAESTAQGLKIVKLAQKTLDELAKKDEQYFVVDVESGGSLWHTIAKRLEEFGCVFAAARAFEQAQANGDSGEQADSLPFSKWSSKERRLAPPLVVTVDGADCRANALADFLDGSVKIILLLRGESSPAPLIRLVTPGTMVVQATDISGLKRLGKWEGPGIGALVPESAARFVHDPKAGAGSADRISIGHLPDNKRRKPLGGISIAQQAEEVLQLKALGNVAKADTAVEEADAPVNPADKLAAWLLTRADLDDAG